jgi:hypothetical protein
MAEYPIDTIEDRVLGILGDLSDKIMGIDSVYLVDLDNIEVVSSYPTDESQRLAFISEISGNNVHQFETQAKDSGREIFLTEMEILTEDYRIFITRVARDYLLCIVGDIRRFRSGFAKRLCEGPVKDELISTLSRAGIPLSPIQR